MSEIESTNIDMLIGKVLGRFAYIRLAILFGSVAAKKAGIDSDIDIAVLAKNSLTASEKISIINALAEAFGRPVDLVDLHKVGEPLLGQILQHGKKILGENRDYSELLSRHLVDQADFLPYQNRILSERRKAWIGR